MENRGIDLHLKPGELCVVYEPGVTTSAPRSQPPRGRSCGSRGPVPGVKYAYDPAPRRAPRVSHEALSGLSPRLLVLLDLGLMLLLVGLLFLLLLLVLLAALVSHRHPSHQLAAKFERLDF